MKYAKHLFLGIGIATMAIIIALTLYNEKTEIQKIDTLSLDFTYDDANTLLKQSLQSQGILVSSPLQFQKQQDIERWCKFFSSQEKQKLVEYCTSTEIKDSSGNFLGNIHIVGSPEAPKLVLVALQSNPFFENMSQIKTIFGAATKELVCDCWETVKPDGYDTLDNWIDALGDFHTGGNKPHSESKSIPLALKHVQIQLTTTTEGFVWEMLIAK
ncbi:MAG: hypothetical protein ACT4N5_01615 [Nitrosopumilaceae archaeon]